MTPSPADQRRRLVPGLGVGLRPRLFREIKRRLCAAIAVHGLFRGRDKTERLLRPGQIPGLNIAFRQPPNGVHVLRIGLQDRCELRRRAADIARGESGLRVFEASLAALSEPTRVDEGAHLAFG